MAKIAPPAPVKASKAPVKAPPAPVMARPGKPGAPVAVKAPAPVALPRNVKAPETPASVVAQASAKEQALSAEIASLKNEIVKLAKAAARAATPTKRTPEEILEGAMDLISGDDWRAPYVGSIVFLKGHSRDARTQKLTLHEGDPSVPHLMAIPRDNDGPYGAQARATGELAAHFTRAESGEYLGLPTFYNRAELAELWDDALNG